MSNNLITSNNSVATTTVLPKATFIDGTVKQNENQATNVPDSSNATPLPNKLNGLNPQQIALYEQLQQSDPDFSQLSEILAGINTTMPAGQEDQVITDNMNSVAQLLGYFNAKNLPAEYANKVTALTSLVSQYQSTINAISTDQNDQTTDQPQDSDQQISLEVAKKLRQYSLESGPEFNSDGFIQTLVESDPRLRVLHDTANEVTNFTNQQLGSNSPVSLFGDEGSDTNTIDSLSKNDNIDFVIIICIAILLLVAQHQGKILKLDRDALTVNSDADDRLVDAEAAFNAMSAAGSELPITITDSLGNKHTINDMMDLVRFAEGKDCYDSDNQLVAANEGTDQRSELKSKLAPMIEYLSTFKDPTSTDGISYLDEMLQDDIKDNAGKIQAASHQLFSSVADQINGDLKQLKCGQVSFFNEKVNGVFVYDSGTLADINTGINQGVTAGSSVSNQEQATLKAHVEGQEGVLETLGNMITALSQMFQAIRG